MSETIKKGDSVKVEYTGKLKDGTVFDSSEGRSPLSFKVGSGQVIPGFDNAIEGMKKDESKTITLSVDDAYGPIRAELVQVFPRDKLPEKPEPQVGMMLVMQAPTGQQIPAKITKVEEGNVTIDINHPLAGKELTFELKVVGVNEPGSEDEEECSGCGDDDCSDCDDSEEDCGDCSSCSGCSH
ncbi:peptidylprolyl isomerase [Candidatus Woesearchaeota archaeon CG_4_10_14_0_2_um_filter_33_13]|nr:MAG: peptidylprolyl isomerase [Candidatus Woesearchaeota archaeon CG_4_10_14_0_2_um_filter_33_13]